MSQSGAALRPRHTIANCTCASRTIGRTLIALICAFGFLSSSALSQAPRAGSTISNTASATFTDGSGVSRSA